jgi:hypothetical protein
VTDPVLREKETSAAILRHMPWWMDWAPAARGLIGELNINFGELS